MSVRSDPSETAGTAKAGTWTKEEILLVVDNRNVMQRTHAAVGTMVRGSRWGLPWICALALASSLAYGLNTAVSGGPAGPPLQLSASAALSSADSGRSVVPARCVASVADPIYAGVDMDSSIVAEIRLGVPC